MLDELVKQGLRCRGVHWRHEPAPAEPKVQSGLLVEADIEGQRLDPTVRNLQQRNLFVLGLLNDVSVFAVVLGGRHHQETDVVVPQVQRLDRGEVVLLDRQVKRAQA
jgi:hypothetical protein